MDKYNLHYIFSNWFNILIKDKKLPKQLVIGCIEQYEKNYIFFTKDNNYKGLKVKLLKPEKILISDIRIFFNLVKQDVYTDFIFTGNLKSNEEYIFDIKFNNTLYVSFNRFSDINCYKAINDIIKHANKKFLILDLRGNSGGDIENTIKICNLLTEKCEVVTLQYKYKNITYFSDEKKICFKNIIIFVDKHTASSSEILALSLKENNNNVYILGTSTKNKKIGQTSYTNKKYKYYFTYSSFKWTVNGFDTTKLNEYIDNDNKFNNHYNNYNDYMKAYINLINNT